MLMLTPLMADQLNTWALPMKRTLAILLVGIACLFASDGAVLLALQAEESAREITVATKVTPPFAMKDQNGNWSGISIDLWQRIADQLKLHYRFVEEPTVQRLLEGTENQTYDAAIAAITVTSERESVLDFSQPYYVSGLGIAVSRDGPLVWGQIGRTLTSVRFLRAILALLGIALLVAFLIWIFERRHNDEFGGPTLKGLGSSMWWSAEMMTQASPGFGGPKTLPGRIVAVVWMAASIVVIAIFTAGVTTVLTTQKLQGLVQEVSDLSSVRVGATSGTATTEYLSARGIRYMGYVTPQVGLKALQAGAIDVFVYDKPLLLWVVEQEFSESIDVLDIDFDPQPYAVAFQRESKLREPFNVAMLDAIKSEWWKQSVFHYLGKR
jgi:polar amino acid transport system substrate-binding protein